MAPRRPRRGTGSNPSRQNAADNLRHDRAWLAVKAFNEMRPMLTSFARAVTGNNSVNVRAGKGVSKTNGKDIFIVPPISLGDRPQHEKELCGKRDPETRIMLCHACAASDLLDRRLFHEIAHIAFDSHKAVQNYHRERMHNLVDEWHPKDACNHAPALHTKMRTAQSYIGLAQDFSPYLGYLLKAYDDARVDSKMYRTRPGLKQPTLAALHAIFTRGIETDDGSLVQWRDAKLNGQIIIGLMLVGMGIEIKPGWLSDEAIEYLNDPELLRISDRAHLANTVINSFDIALAAFLRLQEMELCYVPKCVPTPSLNAEPEPNEDKDKDDDSDGCNSGGTGDGNAEPSDSKDKDNNESGDDKGELADDAAPEAQPESQDSSGGAGDGADPGDGGRDEPEQDAGTEGDSGDEDADGGSDGDDSEAGAGDDKSDDGAVRDEDARPESEDESDGQDADDPADRHGDGDGGDSPEPDAGDEDGEPGSAGEGDRDDSDGEDDAEQDREGDDGAGESDHNGSDGEPGEADQGSGAGGGGPAADDGTEAPTEAGEDLAEDDEPAGDGADGGHDDFESADDDLEQAEDLTDDDGSEASGRPLGESVWDEDNPESEVDPSQQLSPEQLQALMGTPEEVNDLLDKFLGHGHEEEIDAELLGDPPPEEMADERDVQAVITAIGQEAVFDTSSKTVRGVQVVQYPHPAFGWQGEREYGYKPDDFMPAESIIGQNLMQARIVFSENKRAKTQANLKSGKINTRVLGRRAALGDERLFKKRTLPGKRDYFVVITADCSGSTSSSRRNERIKRAVFAKAELLNRLGIPFAIYGHTGGEGDINVGWWSDHPARDDMTEVWLMQIKGAEEPWNDATKQRLADMPPVAENLDGHTLEYMRKVAEKSTATDRIIIYYTDGAMPAANYDEELVILETEIEKCKRSNITLMAVGINTDSPERYGFDTVRVDSDEDLSAVVDRLKARLTS